MVIGSKPVAIQRHGRVVRQVAALRDSLVFQRPDQHRNADFLRDTFKLPPWCVLYAGTRRCRFRQNNQFSAACGSLAHLSFVYGERLIDIGGVPFVK